MTDLRWCNTRSKVFPELGEKLNQYSMLFIDKETSSKLKMPKVKPFDAKEYIHLIHRVEEKQFRLTSKYREKQLAKQSGVAASSDMSATAAGASAAGTAQPEEGGHAPKRRRVEPEADAQVPPASFSDRILGERADERQAQQLQKLLKLAQEQQQRQGLPPPPVTEQPASDTTAEAQARQLDALMAETLRQRQRQELMELDRRQFQAHGEPRDFSR